MNHEEHNVTDEEFLKRVEQAAHDGAKAGARGHIGGSIFRGLFGSIIKLVILVAIIMYAASALNPINKISQLWTFDNSADSHDLVLENDGIWGYTAADFAEPVLGASSVTQKLEVYTKDVSDVTTITDTGFANIKAFTKTQMVTYSGKAIYTVDLSKISESSITVDNENKTVTLAIPHVETEGAVVPSDGIEVGEVQKGILAFGKIKLTTDEQASVEEEATNRMNEKLESENVAADADEAALKMVQMIYQPVIKAVAPDATFEVVFAE